MSDHSRRSSRNIALLIDGDNASPSTLESALTILGDLGTVNIRRIYGNWSKPGLKGWSELVHRYALEPQQQFDVTKGKNATDMKMTIDAMDLLYGGHVDGFGLMTSDSDFMPLAIRIRQNGTPVYGFGTDRTPEAFREACTRFIDLGALNAEQGAKTTGSEVPVAKPQVEDALVELLGDAWRASKRDDEGFASLSEVGQRAANRSSFDARSYGFSRLSELVQSLPQFAIEQRANGVFVKRMR
ncbi:NYN domain-containing protein [Novosphingobium mangrovi (ex Hu et al. 2023)]|uniref:NYN domain-containing protein n=1 Tax=Novosphingobium mangrovi (ex Hu et al. 2023) TaxID=2930094 RepID=A0ABT0A9G2_9SPHN|nr:NYN domain-containing protein [Novosphingobium mangrovi (ex Hu et al. 2023)]MCJ1959844.1 NYN domain-containing protein [Novosphingobium mangrovi (ex Hu et al. 2023)]